MMPHPVIAGKHTLNTPNDAIITYKLAKRLFKNENPIGKTLKVSTGDVVTVTGVIDEPSTKASVQFEIIISKNLRNSWSRMASELVQLHRAEDVTELNKKNRNLWNCWLMVSVPYFIS
ncbi:MAG: ABC transporter permease [Bacteroides cellulosilyticus]